MRVCSRRRCSLNNCIQWYNSAQLWGSHGVPLETPQHGGRHGSRHGGISGQPPFEISAMLNEFSNAFRIRARGVGGRGGVAVVFPTNVSKKHTVQHFEF